MSTSYRPNNPKKTKKTGWSYKDGSFDMNVDGGQWLGRVHEYLQLPVANDIPRGSPPRVPWVATAAQTRAWAERLTVALDVFRINTIRETAFIRAWRDFLQTCGGYSVDD